MPGPWGVTNTGFSAKTLEEVRADLVTAARGVYGAAVNVDSRSRLGQFIEIVSEQLSDVWQMGAALAAALNPGAAGGQLADFIASITGTKRRPAKKSNVRLIAFGATGTILETGRRVRVAGTSATFETDRPWVLFPAPAWVGNTWYGAQWVASSSGALWYSITAGLGNTAPSGPGPLFVEGTLVWLRLGVGDAYASIYSEATVTGPVQGFAGTISIIDTPVVGWNGVVNPLDAVVGTDAETDSELRVRRLLELSPAASTPLDAIRTAVRKVEGVTTCLVFENTSDTTVGFLPPHSIGVLVEGGDDVAIRDAIYRARPGGIETVGTTSGTITDSAGVGHVIRHSRPTSVPIYSAVTVTIDQIKFPTDGVTQVQQAVLAAIAAHVVGQDVYATRLAAACFPIPGVLSSTGVVGIAPNPSGSSVSIDYRSRAANSGTVTVALVSGSP